MLQHIFRNEEVMNQACEIITKKLNTKESVELEHLDDELFSLLMSEDWFVAAFNRDIDKKLLNKQINHFSPVADLSHLKPQVSYLEQKISHEK